MPKKLQQMPLIEAKGFSRFKHDEVEVNIRYQVIEVIVWL